MHFSKKTKWNQFLFGWSLVCLMSGLWAVPTQCPAQAERGQPAPETGNKAPNPQVKIEWLFVQNAEGVTFNNGKMTLKKISPETVMFADRPERIAGHITTKAFLPLWTEGKDSFTHDPPNATLSVFNEKGEPQDIVVEISNPQLNGDELTYDVRVLEG